jgi:hypothetical protein
VAPRHTQAATRDLNKSLTHTTSHPIDGAETPNTGPASARRSHVSLTSVRNKSDMQANFDDDFWRRTLIERRPPLTWKGICACAIASAAGIGLGLTKPTGEWELLALGLSITGGIQTLRAWQERSG